MRKLLTAIFAALVVAAIGLPMHAQAARVNTLIKGSGATIYWAADNGKKYSFPNIATFYTWFTSNDMKAVKKITDKELKSIPTGGNVTYRGGAKLVKFPNESTVYAVSRYSVLHPIANQDVATQLYGWNWSSWVENLPWNLRGDYTIGSTIRSSTDYSASNEYNGVKTPTDNINRTATDTRSPYNPIQPTAQFNGTVSLSLENRLYTPERAQFTATVANSNRKASEITIQIKNESRNEIVQTCYASYTCSATWYVDTVATQEFVAIAKDASGYSLGSNRLSVQGNNYPYYSSYNTYPYSNTYNTYPYYNYNYTYGTYPYYQTTFAADRSLTAEWTADRTLKLTGRITSYNRPIADLRMAIIDTNNSNQALKYCDGTDSCMIDVRTDNNWVNSSRYALRVYEVNGQEMGYVYANSVGTNTYANDYYGYNYNYGYNGYNYGYSYGNPNVTTYVSRWNDSWSYPTVSITGSVSNVNYLTNTRLEVYAVSNNWNNNSPRLLNTCYNTSTCTAQDTPATGYATSYYTVFMDGNGVRSFSENRSY